MKRYLTPICIAALLSIQWICGQEVSKKNLEQDFENPSLNDSIRFEAGTDFLMNQLKTNLDSARSTGFKLLKFAESLDEPNHISQAYRLIGITYAVQSKFEESLTYFIKSYDILIELEKPIGLATTINNIGTVNYELGRYPEAQKFLLESLKMAEEEENLTSQARTLNNLGNVHYDWKNNEQALGYYKRSLAIKEQLGIKEQFPSVLNNIGLVYTNLKDHENSVLNLKESAIIADEVGDVRGVSRAYSNLGVEYARTLKFDSALSYLDKAISVQAQTNDLDGLAASLLSRGKNFYQLEQYIKSKKDCSKCLDMALTSGALNLQKEAYECLADATEKLGEFRNSLDFRKQFQSLKDSLFNKEKTQEMTKAEVTFQFEKQQLADQLVFQQAINKERDKLFIVLVIGFVIVVLMVFLYWRYTQNLKFKQLENKMLSVDLEHQKNDLTNFAVNISNNHNWAESLNEKVALIKSSDTSEQTEAIKELEKEIRNRIWVNKETNEFNQKIDAFGTAFYKKLTDRFTDLTKNEIRLCSLIKLNMDTKQIAQLQSINPSSVKMNKNRLRKKLNLAPEDDIYHFLQSF